MAVPLRAIRLHDAVGGVAGGAGPAGSVLVINGAGGTVGASGESQCSDSEWNLSATYADEVLQLSAGVLRPCRDQARAPDRRGPARGFG